MHISTILNHPRILILSHFHMEVCHVLLTLNHPCHPVSLTYTTIYLYPEYKYSFLIFVSWQITRAIIKMYHTINVF